MNPDMKELVRAFHDKHHGGHIDISQEHQELRRDLLREEYEEYVELVDREGFDEEEITKELVDIIYIIFGTSIAHDLDIYEKFLEVHAENMNKDTLKSKEDLANKHEWYKQNKG